MISVMIAGPYEVVRHGLKEILEQESDIRVTREACSVKELLDGVPPRDCDVLIFDFDMQRRGGIDVLRELAAQDTAMPIIAISIQSEEEFGGRVLRAGAKAYLTKGSISETLVRAVRKACATEPLVGAALVQVPPS